MSNNSQKNSPRDERNDSSGTQQGRTDPFYEEQKIMEKNAIDHWSTETPSFPPCKETLGCISYRLQTSKICENAVLENEINMQFVNPELLTPDFIMKVVRAKGSVLRFVNVRMQTPENVLAAVRSCGTALKYVDKTLRTSEVCKEAVNADPLAIEYVVGCSKNKYEDMCSSAVTRNKHALIHIDPKVENYYDLCMTAVFHDGDALPFVKCKDHPNYNLLCLIAAERWGPALRHIRNQTARIVLVTVRRCGMALEFVKDQTAEVVMAAVKNDGRALKFVNADLHTYEVDLAAVQENGDALAFVNTNYTPEEYRSLCVAAVQSDGFALKNVPNPTPELYRMALKQIRSTIKPSQTEGRYLKTTSHYANIPANWSSVAPFTKSEWDLVGISMPAIQNSTSALVYTRRQHYHSDDDDDDDDYNDDDSRTPEISMPAVRNLGSIPPKYKYYGSDDDDDDTAWVSGNGKSQARSSGQSLTKSTGSDNDDDNDDDDGLGAWSPTQKDSDPWPEEFKLKITDSKTLKMCIDLVSSEGGNALRRIDARSISPGDYNQLCVAAVSKDGNALKFVNRRRLLPDDYFKIVNLAIQQKPSIARWATKLIPKRTTSTAVSQRPTSPIDRLSQSPQRPARDDKKLTFHRNSAPTSTSPALLGRGSSDLDETRASRVQAFLEKF